MKFFSINKNQAAVITTLLVLIFLGAGYFFIYLPQNEKRIQQQHFNALQNIDGNIHSRIENSFALLNTLLTGYQDADTADKERLVRYFKNYSSDNFLLSIPYAVKLADRRAIRESDGVDSAYSIRVNNDTKEISLFFTKIKSLQKNDTILYEISMRFTFSQFLSFLLKKDLFDEYIVFSKNKSIYESFPAGISYVVQDSLLGFKNGIGGPGVRSQVISGSEYKMFLQPVSFDGNNEWIIGGLLSNEHYQNEKMQLSTRIILLLATIMLIGMLAFPWLKLYQMGSKDRLTISDGIASVFISMLLVSLIFFVFFNYNQAFRPTINKNSKASLANGIYKAFKDEIDTAYGKLRQFDTLVSLPGRDILLKKDTIVFTKGNDPVPHAGDIKLATQNIKINQVYWLNKNGDEIINWAADNIMNAPHGNFKNREYFKKIEENREYLIGGDENKRFYLDQVMSWTSGVFRSVISMKSTLSSSGDLVVAALSFNFKSLDKVVLPAGYLYAITDNYGNVLYHSESSRNLNENLLNVFSKSGQLKSCLDARAPGRFSTKYYDSNYDVEVRPVNDLPYFIVILEDSVYSETRDMEIYSFTFSMLLLFFSFLVVQLFAIFIVSAKKSFFKKQLLETSWIGPKISNQKEYILSTVFNCVIIVLLICFFSHTTFLEYIFILLFSVTLVPLFLNSIFARKYLLEKNSVSKFKAMAKYCLWTFIGVITIAAFKLLDLPGFLWLTGYLLLVIFLAAVVYAVKGFVYKTAYQFKASSKCRLLLGKWNYIDSFALMAFTRLIITSGLPVVFFYITSYNYEQNLSMRYRQLDFAERLAKKNPGALLTAHQPTNNKWNGIYYDSSIINNISLTPRAQSLADSVIQPYSKEEENTIGLLKLFRWPITDKAVIEDRFYNPVAVDSSFFFNHLLQEASGKSKGSITYRKSSLPGQDIKLSSENLNYHYPSIFKANGFNGGLFWVMLACILFIFYFILKSIIKKLFCLNLPDIEVWYKLDDKILINKDWGQPLFVIGLPGSGKKKYLVEKIANGEIALDDNTPLYLNNDDENKNNVFIAELINIPSTGNEQEETAAWNEYIKKVFNESNRVIIVNHFEYNIQDSLSNRFKLEFLERLYLESKCKIIILSTIHPVAFLDSAMEQAYKQDDKSSAGQDLERWHVLLGHYRIIVLPLQLSSSYPINSLLHGSIIDQFGNKGLSDVLIAIKGTLIETTTRTDGQFILPDYPLPFIITISLEGYLLKEVDINNIDNLDKINLVQGPSFKSAQLIRNETNHTYFLKKLQAPAFSAGEDLSEEIRIAKFDELAFKFQVSSHYFYMYIWQSLTKEEKFLLYDLAEDNLVNSFDNYNLSMLIAKGVVIRPDGTLKLFNKGFRNFILTAIGNSEAIKIKNRIKENGNWNTLKNPLQLVILAILAFLLTSQEEAFAKLITYVAALGAAVPAVLKLFSFFDKNSQKPT